MFWVHAGTKARFQESYQSIAEKLGLPRRNDPNVNTLGLVSDWLRNEEIGRWLMILDNADDVTVFYPKQGVGQDKTPDRPNRPTSANHPPSNAQPPLASFLPKSRNGKVVITSRSIDASERLAGSHKNIFRVLAMDQDQALQLFRNKLKKQHDEDGAADLLRALDYIPLAVTQAAAYINRRAPRMSIRGYLDEFRRSDKRKESLLNRGRRRSSPRRESI